MKDLDRGRYTSEDAVLKIGNRYDLVLVATARARESQIEHCRWVRWFNGCFKEYVIYRRYRIYE